MTTTLRQHEDNVKTMHNLLSAVTVNIPCAALPCQVTMDVTVYVIKSLWMSLCMSSSHYGCHCTCHWVTMDVNVHVTESLWMSLYTSLSHYEFHCVCHRVTMDVTVHVTEPL